ncbi:hypothetical protein LCGC14_2175920 [marine sediment metagenome]|uniref:Uncharacterized protein n=1 Tax=marine sediment metagenome TaxID=412755 RepID=A0A0F9G1C8_9ZZZZ
MIDFDLAIELKRAGYPQTICDPKKLDIDIEKNYSSVCLPDTDDLLEQLGDEFKSLELSGGGWFAVGKDLTWKEGKSPVEALARLWIALKGVE